MSEGGSYRGCLKHCLGAILLESGFDGASESALETLLELLGSLISEIGRSSRAFSELGCRSQPLGADVVLALVEMGIPPYGIREYALRHNRTSLPNPSTESTPKVPSILQIGDRPKRLKNHFIPDHFPELPDSHSFIRTCTHKQPVRYYENVREKASGQKRDVERALTRFIAKTGKTHSLFNTDDTNLYPLISCQRSTIPGDNEIPPYLNALLFKDQVFEEDEREYLPKKRKLEEEEEEKKKKEKEKKEAEKKKKKKKKKEKIDDNDTSEDEEQEEEKVKEADQNNETNPEGDEDEDKKDNKKEETSVKSEIDNPYLRPVKLPRPVIKAKRML